MSGEDEVTVTVGLTEEGVMEGANDGAIDGLLGNELGIADGDEGTAVGKFVGNAVVVGAKVGGGKVPKPVGFKHKPEAVVG